MSLDDNPRYTVTLTVRVDDPDTLFEAAVAKHLDVDPETAREEFLNADGSTNVEACLQYAYDPGDSVPGTELEQVEAQED